MDFSKLKSTRCFPDCMLNSAASVLLKNKKSLLVRFNHQAKYSFLLFLFLRGGSAEVMPRIEPRASHMQNGQSSTELHPQPSIHSFIKLELDYVDMNQFV